MQAIKRETTVDANHEIRIALPELPVGSRAEVIVLVNGEPEPSEPEDFTSLLGKHPRFKSLEEVVAHVRELREDRP